MVVNSKANRRIRKRKPPRALSDMHRIIDRCLPWSYGNDYSAALLATRSEGPSKGRLHRVPLPKWDRDMHFMSAAEARVAVYVIYQPNFLEGLENRPCLTIPGIPILDGHPLARGKTLPYSSGTIEIARSLGFKHPVTSDDRCEDRIRNEGPQRDFFPLITDLLALLKDQSGIRAVNLFIKKSQKDLELSKRGNELYMIERALHVESHIPTVKICEQQLDPIVTNNLVRLAKIARRPKEVSEYQLAHALLYMEERIFYSAPNTWETCLRENLGLLPETIFRIFHYGVFQRHLKVDLKEAVAMDRVHRQERFNYAADFAARFLEPLQ
jgi:hypothetical protein